MNKRKMIQITSGDYNAIFALADDGTLWFAAINNPKGFTWRKMKDLPDKE